MYFEDFHNHQDAKLNPKLLWEFDMHSFDFMANRNLTVQRVIERGWPADWYFILNLYGLDGVKLAIKEIVYLNEVDLNFVSHQFAIPKTSMKCCENKQSVERHWTS